MRKRLALVLIVCACILAVSLTACAKTHKIMLDAEKYCVQSCPEAARSGEVVTVETSDVCDASLYVSVDGDQDFGRFTSHYTYEFTMPDHDVTVRVWVVSNGLA